MDNFIFGFQMGAISMYLLGVLLYCIIGVN